MKVLNYAFMLLVVMSCASIKYGNKFSDKDVLKIQKCMSKKADLEQIFGEPFRTGIQSGYQYSLWSYSDTSINPFSSTDTIMRNSAKNRKDLFVFFNQNDIVVDYALNPTGTVQIIDNCK